MSYSGWGVSADARLLGVLMMSAALPAGAEGDGASTKGKIEAALGLLTEVVELLDASSAPPELTARVQEALDALAEYGETD